MEWSYAFAAWISSVTFDLPLATWFAWPLLSVDIASCSLGCRGDGLTAGHRKLGTMILIIWIIGNCGLWRPFKRHNRGLFLDLKSCTRKRESRQFIPVKSEMPQWIIKFSYPSDYSVRTCLNFTNGCILLGSKYILTSKRSSLFPNQFKLCVCVEDKVPYSHRLKKAATCLYLHIVRKGNQICHAKLLTL